VTSISTYPPSEVIEFTIGLNLHDEIEV